MQIYYCIYFSSNHTYSFFELDRKESQQKNRRFFKSQSVDRNKNICLLHGYEKSTSLRSKTFIAHHISVIYIYWYVFKECCKRATPSGPTYTIYVLVYTFVVSPLNVRMLLSYTGEMNECVGESFGSSSNFIIPITAFRCSSVYITREADVPIHDHILESRRHSN